MQKKKIRKGPIAVIECYQEIPCNPCEAVCKFDSIKIGKPITNKPVFIAENCTGCGQCIASCPGLAIFVVYEDYSEGEGMVSFPYEYLPLPEKGQIIDAVDRNGSKICKGRVVKIINKKSFDRTSVITIVVPKKYVNQVRSIKILKEKNLRIFTK